MKVSFLLDDLMGADTFVTDLPQIPSMGDTVVVNDRAYIVIKIAWVLSEDPGETSVSIAATSK